MLRKLQFSLVFSSSTSPSCLSAHRQSCSGTSGTAPCTCSSYGGFTGRLFACGERSISPGTMANLIVSATVGWPLRPLRGDQLSPMPFSLKPPAINCAIPGLTPLPQDRRGFALSLYVARWYVCLAPPPFRREKKKHLISFGTRPLLPHRISLAPSLPCAQLWSNCQIIAPAKAKE